MAIPEPDEQRTIPGLAIPVQHRLAILLLLGTNFMLSVDFSILNIALLEVGRAVGLDLANLPWITAAFALPAAGLSLLFGRLGDLYGHRRMFMIGLSLLTVASLLGGIATGPALLLVARTLQGMAAAMTAPAALSLLITTFANQQQRARVLGWNGTLLSGGFAVGALVGAGLVGILSWRWAFLINVPFSILILALTPLVVPLDRNPRSNRLDIPGAASATFGLLALVYGVTEQHLPTLAAGGALLALVVWIERRVTAPLVAVEMLTRPSIRWGNVAVLTIFSMEAGLVFLMTLYLQEVLRLGPSTTGLIFGVPGLASVVAGIVAGRMVARRGALPVLLAALLVQGGFTAPLMLLGVETSWLWLLIPTLFLGFLGHITAVVAAIAIATSEASATDAGLATGLVTTSQRVAVTVGVPLLASVMALRADLLAGIHLALAVNVFITAVAAALIGWGLGKTRL